MANTDLATIESSLTEIERTLEACDSTAIASMPALRQSLALSIGVQALKRALTTDIVNALFMPLQGSKLGFLTDKDSSGGYPATVVRDVMIEAMIKKLRPVNNEINIIGGNLYAAKAGMKRLCEEFPGVENLVITPGVPIVASEKTALVSMRAAYRLNGVAKELVRDIVKHADGTSTDTRFAVRVNSGMGPDAVIGKAVRKMYSALHDILSGTSLSITDGEAIEAIGEVIESPPPSPQELDGRRIKLNVKKPAPKCDVDGVVEREPGDDSF